MSNQGEWLSREEVAELCPACADKMASLGIRQIRAAVLLGAEEPQAAKGDKWKKMPPGWTEESRKKMWDSLVGDVKHKVTKCIKQMDGKVDDPGAFCAALADRVEGPKWRERDAASRVARRFREDRVMQTDKQARDELIEATEEFKAALGNRESATGPYKAVAAKAKALKDACAEIEKLANAESYAPIDNWARRDNQLEAMCRLLVKALKKAEGYTPPEKR